MTTITQPRARFNQTRGLTLVEVMVSAGLSAVLLTAVLTTFLFIGRSATNVGNYSDMETEARRGLEIFGRDARQASVIAWLPNEAIDLTVNGNVIRYAYDASEATFTRTAGGTTTVLISGVQNFIWIGNMVNGDPVNTGVLTLAQASLATKQIQIYIEARRSDLTAAATTNTVLSARYILRNKRVTA